ncbi:hypothetical protein ACVW1C_005960 [Bradyrhizobium sp. USDA 4011]
MLTKVYRLHAPVVECIGKGNAHRPCEFGVKVFIATTLSSTCGGQFVIHVKALLGNPLDGHALTIVIPEMEALIGNTIERVLLDKGITARTPRRFDDAFLSNESKDTLWTKF